MIKLITLDYQRQDIANRHVQIIFTAISVICAFILSLNMAFANVGVSQHAPKIAFYIGLTEYCCGVDTHPVHGIKTADGGYALVGKSTDPNGNSDGFLLKLNQKDWLGYVMLSDDQFSEAGWSQMIGTTRHLDALNSVAANDSAIFAGGFIHVRNGTIDRYLAKYDMSIGTEIWEATFADPIRQRDGAIENILLTRSGGLIVTGVINAHSGTFEGFKSYGNPQDGQAYVSYFSADQLDSASAPDAPVWLTLLPESVSGKGIREVSDNIGGYIVATASINEGPARAIRIGANGHILWSEIYPIHGEVTDIAALEMGGKTTGFAMVGHRNGDQGGIDGSITYLDLKGNVSHHITVGNPVGGVGQFSGLGAGHPQLIFDECWGIQGTDDGGVIIACGTGIEGCGEWSFGTAIRHTCNNDPRTTWRGFIVKFNASGEQVWHRVDSFIETEDEMEVMDAASEYVVLTDDEAVISIVDQSFGIGILVLKPEKTDHEPIDVNASDKMLTEFGIEGAQ
jgi:hypothetical protein